MSSFRRLQMQNRARVVVAALHQSVSMASCTLFDHQGASLATRSQCTGTHFSATQADLIFAALLENFQATLREANVSVAHVAAIGLAVEPFEANKFRHSWIPTPPASCLAQCLPPPSHNATKTLLTCCHATYTNPPTPSSALTAAHTQNHTLDTWLCYKLSGGACLLTDETNYASAKRATEAPSLDLRKRLNVVAPTGRLFTMKGCFFDIPVCALASDLQAAMVALRVSEPGDVGVHMGDVCTILAPVKKRGGSVLISPATGRCVPAAQAEAPGLTVLDWLQKLLMFDCDLAEAGQVAATAAPPNFLKPLLIVPPGVRGSTGAIVNLTLLSTRRQLIRAAIEGIAFALAEKLDDLNLTALPLKVCGSLAECVYLTQFLSDVTQTQVHVADAYVQTPLAGIAALAGKELGVWQTLPHTLVSRPRRTHLPRIDPNEAQRLRTQWARALT